MKKTAMIPARFASTRLPGKMLKMLGDKTLIWRTYEAVCNTALFDDVIVVCDHPLIYEEIERNGGRVIKSKTEHACGTDRIAEAATHVPDTDIIVNVQGDEPFTEKESLVALLDVFENDAMQKIQVASLMHILKDGEAISDPNQVKVVVDNQNFALLFSRSPIPYPRNKEEEIVYYKHIGIYAFRRAALLQFSSLPQSRLEKIEQLENLRMLENNIPIKMVLTPHAPIGIDTEADLEAARKRFLA